MPRNRDATPGARKWPEMTFRWPRTVATAFSILLRDLRRLVRGRELQRPAGDRLRQLLGGRPDGLRRRPAAAYDIHLHRLLELSAGKLGGLQPFPYPPPFLLFVLPFGMLPFAVGFGSWVAVTAALYFIAFRRIAPWPYTFAHPANFSNALVGQNGMLTSAIFAGGFTLLDRRPLVAGALFGLLIVKPQLAVLIPVALLAGRYWRAIAAAAVTAVALLLIAWLAFGEETYRAFLVNASHQATLVSGRIPWPKIASAFGALRTMGVPVVPALLVHAAIAIGAAVATWLAWRRSWPTRVPIVAAASLLVSPYLLGHDSVLMMVPIGWLIVHQRRPAIVVLLWAISMLAVAAVGPNPTPVAAILAIAVMWQEARRLQSESPGTAESSPGLRLAAQ